MLFHTYLGTAQIAFDLLPCICIFFGNELCTPYICTRFIVMCLRGFTSCICICICMHLQWPSPWWLGSSCLKSPNWTFPGHCMGEESELEWMPRNWTNERIHMCAHISENLFFSYTFLEHGFGNLGFRKKSLPSMIHTSQLQIYWFKNKFKTFRQSPPKSHWHVEY